MSPASPRIGSVPYLNAEPLVYGLDPAPVRMVPSELARELHAGRLDAALVPVAEYLLHQHDYVLVDHAAVASRGPVYSVILVPDSPTRTIEQIRTVALDPHSRTSNLLTRVLLEIGQGHSIEYVQPGTPADARLMIGDPAMSFRRADPHRFVLDLGQLWQEWTGHPFVYAAWVVRRQADEAFPDLGNRLREARRAGIANRHRIAATPEDFTYLTESVCYTLGDEEKAGLFKFAHYLVELGLLKTVARVIWI